MLAAPGDEKPCCTPNYTTSTESSTCQLSTFPFAVNQTASQEFLKSSTACIIWDCHLPCRSPKPSQRPWSSERRYQRQRKHDPINTRWAHNSLSGVVEPTRILPLETISWGGNKGSAWKSKDRLLIMLFFVVMTFFDPLPFA